MSPGMSTKGRKLPKSKAAWNDTPHKTGICKCCHDEHILQPGTKRFIAGTGRKLPGANKAHELILLNREREAKKRVF